MGRLLIGVALIASLMSPAPAIAQASDDVVRIGVIDDMSGSLSDSAGRGLVVAARMAVEDFGGSVLGRPVEILTADHQNKPDLGVALARKWFDEDKVDMVAGLGNSAVAIAVQQLARDKGRVSIVTAAASSDLTGKFCSPLGFHWVHDTYAMANVVGRAAVKQGRRNWFFLTADYAFGQALERDATRFVTAEGGRVVGSVRFPLGANDFASYLLQAQSSGADTIALAAAGGDVGNLVKQAGEFGIARQGQALAALLVYITDVHAIGLELSQGLVLASPFYWDQTDETRAFGRRFLQRHGAMPTMIQAGTYGAVLHYLKAVRSAGTDASAQVAAQMRELPVEDFMTRGGKARADGRVVRDMALFTVKSPAESKGPWDYYRPLASIPGDQAFRPLSESECPLIAR